MCEVLEKPITSSNDDKIYKVLRLKNGLTACLVSDTIFENDTHSSETNSEWETESDSASVSERSFSRGASSSDSENSDVGLAFGENDRQCEKRSNSSSSRSDGEKKAAISLTIRYGSFYDPPELGGLAHCLEHMIYMGTDKYPKENDFSSFIAESGGFENAETGSETTTFYFDCFMENFDQALDKFSQMFLSPLLNPESLNKELPVIDSEFKLAEVDNDCRIDHFLYMLSDENSPVNNFSWGNQKSLTQRFSYKELSEYLKKFHKKFYTADRMTLAIIGAFTIEQLEQKILKYFDCFPPKQLSTATRDPDFERVETISEAVFHTAEFNRLYYIEAIGDVSELHLTWPLPPVFLHFKQKPGSFFEFFFDDESEGGLFFILKSKNYASEMFANWDPLSDYECNSRFALFIIVIRLTKLGCQFLNEILDYVYTYINVIKNCKDFKKYFDELREIGQMEFKYSDETDAVDLAQNLSFIMQYIPSKYYLTYLDRFEEFNQEVFETFFCKLVPEKMNVMVMLNKKISKKNRKTEKWFGINYRSEEIQESKKEHWRKIGQHVCLKLPPPNQYITKNFNMIKLKTKSAIPILLVNDDFAQIWYKPSIEYELPTVNVYVYLKCKIIQNSAFNMVCLHLFEKILCYHLNEHLYAASVAGISSTIETVDSGLVFTLTGYTEKILVLFKMIFEKMYEIFPKMNSNILSVVKENLIESYYNQLLLPDHLSSEIKKSLTIANYKTTYDKFEVIHSIEINDMKMVVNEFLNGFGLIGFVQGNVEKNFVSAMYETIKKQIRNPNGYEQFSNIKKPLEVPIGENYFLTFSMNERDPNSSISNIYQIESDDSLMTSVMADLFEHLVSEPICDQLRTKKGLCYDVSAFPENFQNMTNFVIEMSVDANKYEAKIAENHIEEFLNEFETKVLSEQLTEKAISSLIKLKKVPWNSLDEEADFNWSEIFLNTLLFNRLQQEIELLKTIKFDQIRDWIVKNFHGKKSMLRRKLSIQVTGFQNDKKSNDSRQSRRSSISSSSSSDTDGDCNNTYLIRKSMKPQVQICSRCNDKNIESLQEFISKLKIK